MTPLLVYQEKEERRKGGKDLALGKKKIEKNEISPPYSTGREGERKKKDVARPLTKREGRGKETLPPFFSLPGGEGGGEGEGGKRKKCSALITPAEKGGKGEEKHYFSLPGKRKERWARVV